MFCKLILEMLGKGGIVSTLKDKILSHKNEIVFIGLLSIGGCIYYFYKSYFSKDDLPTGGENS